MEGRANVIEVILTEFPHLDVDFASTNVNTTHKYLPKYVFTFCIGRMYSSQQRVPAGPCECSRRSSQAGEAGVEHHRAKGIHTAYWSR